MCVCFCVCICVCVYLDIPAVDVLFYIKLKEKSAKCKQTLIITKGNDKNQNFPLKTKNYSVNDVGKTKPHVKKKKKRNTDLIPYTKIGSKLIKELKVQNEILKL